VFSFFYMLESYNMEIARNVMDRDSYFINIADEVATRSKDPSTQV
jgi:deoxycytidylate deaminase